MVPSESVCGFDTQNSRSFEIKIATQAKQEAEQDGKNDWETKERRGRGGWKQGELKYGACLNKWHAVKLDTS